ncbi:MAG: thioesterase family protein [Ilumatobacter sp.]|uniref:acyl-CoA thioesterase n=1 Tax=Ilumatobacter sp. TaxID=1967498 RepID=UPI00262E219A|nr:acyl-CoA thioesterase domain-containing protein [Ilumatobacter sp.]MDJ0768449.1 thioesterase family protein [Ilumatobacter sp.]
MDSRSFLGLEDSHNPFRWKLDVRADLCTSGRFLFGGAGLASAISALEGTSGRRCIWATGQYLSYARTGEVMDIDVTIAVEGHQITQARAVGHVGNREILTVNAALGDRPDYPAGQFEQMPTVPPPEDCPPRPTRSDTNGTINERVDVRLAKGRLYDELDGVLGDGRTIMWGRVPDVIEGVDATSLAIMGDYVPSGVGQALGRRGGGNSLDNTLRVLHLVPTEWVLLDIRVHGVERGFGHGLVHMFAEDGTLLATASQSCIVRFHKS